ncbi:hypothetical protein BMS3Abin04_02207 [bacterium BMS3Abin04]|nr:hypothetical protein BMS3Abin04_02207 [bacterium BMS3Abin04]
MAEHYFFYIGLAFILVHEMDAIRLQEWRMFPILSGLKDQNGYLIFTLLHLPLYVLIFWGLWGSHGSVINLILGLDIFFIIHIGLHLLLIKHKENQFGNFFSWSLILLTGIFGLLDLITGF